MVALYTSAWIEMPNAQRIEHTVRVALYTSAWIEILGGNNVASMRVSRTLHECVD